MVTTPQNAIESPAPEATPISTEQPVASSDESTPQPTAVVDATNSVVADALQGAGASLLNGTWNFLKCVIGPQVQKIAAMPGINTAALNLFDDWKFLTAGLTNPFKNLFEVKK